MQSKLETMPPDEAYLRSITTQLANVGISIKRLRSEIDSASGDVDVSASTAELARLMVRERVLLGCYKDYVHADEDVCYDTRCVRLWHWCHVRLNPCSSDTKPVELLFRIIREQTMPGDTIHVSPSTSVGRQLLGKKRGQFVSCCLPGATPGNKRRQGRVCGCYRNWNEIPEEIRRSVA